MTRKTRTNGLVGVLHLGSAPSKRAGAGDFTIVGGPGPHSIRRKDWYGLDVTDAVFRNCQFEDILAEKVTFSNCRFEDCRFEASTFNRVVFARCTLNKVTFAESELRDVLLRDGTTVDCTFSDVLLEQTKLLGKLTRVRLHGVDADKVLLSSDSSPGVGAAYQGHYGDLLVTSMDGKPAGVGMPKIRDVEVDLPRPGDIFVVRRGFNSVWYEFWRVVSSTAATAMVGKMQTKYEWLDEHSAIPAVAPDLTLPAGAPFRATIRQPSRSGERVSLSYKGQVGFRWDGVPRVEVSD